MKGKFTGWKNIKGLEVYIEDGIVKRGVKGQGNNQVTAYIYIPAEYGNGYIICNTLTEAAFRARLHRGTVILK